MLALDKFKRRLVRDIARRIYQDKQSEYDMWTLLKREYGCDCHLLWEHMRALTLKKLKRLLAAEDRIDNITSVARMTSTDWLTFDLVLVHDTIDVIGEGMIFDDKPEPAVLTELVYLVEKYDIENLPSKNLIEAWFNLTKEYNTGGRQCSPMLLQRRWYQLKEITRSRIYKFWKSYRGNPKQLDNAKSYRPSPLQLMIAERYPNIITHPFEQWSDLILKKQVVLAGAFERRRTMGSNNCTKDNDPDLIVVEPNVETIELAADSDNDDENIESTGTNCKSSQSPQEKLNADITIKTEPPDVLVIDVDENIVQQLQNVDIPVKNNIEELENVPLSTEHTEAINSELTEIPELNLPRITSVMGNVIISESYTEINEFIDNRDIIKKTNLSGESAKISSQISSVDNVVESVIVEVENNKINCDSNIVTNVDELPFDLNFVDDGIELVDHEVDSMLDEQNQEERKDQQQDIEESKKNDDDTITEIDKKLIMFPISYTKKLDHMNIFKDKSYDFVEGDHIIKCAIAESKPVFKDIFSSALNEEPNKDMYDNTDEGINRDQFADDDSESYEVPRVNYTSWLLQKPKSRSYNPIQLCKNPDFNTRLKRLTVGFFSIERNRQLFNACKPLTIDLHKQFENKLVDNTLYLQNTNILEIKQEKNSDTCKSTVSVIPSAIPVQSLLDKSKVKVEDLLRSNIDEIEPVNSPVSDSNKVINLSEIDQLRLVNKNLLTAEISPIPLNVISSVNKPPVQLIKSPDLTAVNDFQPSSVSINDKVNLNCKQIKKKRVILPKKFIVPKVKPFSKRPPWSCLSQEPVDDSLITRDTLDKVFCVLKGVEVKKKNTKRKRSGSLMEASKSMLYNNKSIASNEKSHFEINKNNNKAVVNAINDDELKKSVAFLQTQNTELSKVNSKNKPVKSIYIPSDQIYCCWAQFKLQSLVNNFDKRGPKPRHKCPKLFCTCCCRDLLLELKIVRKRVNKNLTASTENDVLNTQITKIYTSFRGNENDLVKDCLPPSEEAESNFQIVSIDTTKDLDSESSIQCPLLTNFVPDSFGTVQFEMEAKTVPKPFVCLKNDVAVDTNEIILSGKSDDKSVNEHSGSYTEVKRNFVPQVTKSHHIPKVKVNVLQKPPLIKADDVKSKNNSETAIETISLLDDESTDSTELSPPPLPVTETSPKPILPKGVNLILLPDNSLSVNINPDVVIDQESLSKLPEILIAVQKQLSQTILQRQPQIIETNVIEANEKLNSSCNMLTEQNLEHNIVNSEIESNTLLNVPNTLADTVTNKLRNENFQLDTSKLSLDNSNVSESVFTDLNTNDQLENDVLCIEKSEGKMKTTQSKVIVEADSCHAKTNINRKSILSDLMTMSGISPEDVNTSVEGSVSLPPTIDNSRLDYPSILVNNGNKKHKLNKKKIVKKFMISIRKTLKEKELLDTNSVLDLTEDNETTIDEVKKNEEGISPLRSLLKKYITKYKSHNPVQPNETLKPVKLFKTTSSPLSQDANALVPFEKVDSHVKLLIAKHYRQYNRKPPPLQILQSNGQVMEVQYKQTDKRKSDSDSDPSDDEPLAKKLKRINDKNNMNSPEQDNEATDTDIVEVPKYDLPIEFENTPTELDEKSENIDSCNEVEGYCILGV